MAIWVEHHSVVCLNVVERVRLVGHATPGAHIQSGATIVASRPIHGSPQPSRDALLDTRDELSTPRFCFRSSVVKTAGTRTAAVQQIRQNRRRAEFPVPQELQYRTSLRVPASALPTVNL